MTSSPPSWRGGPVPSIPATSLRPPVVSCLVLCRAPPSPWVPWLSLLFPDVSSTVLHPLGFSARARPRARWLGLPSLGSGSRGRPRFPSSSSFSHLSPSPAVARLRPSPGVADHCRPATPPPGLGVTIFPVGSESLPLPLLPACLPTRPTWFFPSQEVMPSSPQFTTESGHVASCFWFHHHIRLILAKSGIDPSLYSAHSFRIGVASSASS